ncbi:MAG: LON peptidase substrate-binding domain-containing protein [Nitriliruptoraceae bacterium]
MQRLAMFPLGTVLLPHMVLPLQVFEPRYQRLLEDVLAGDGRFGVVLISRGQEVGGGEVRTDLGTIAQVLRAEPLDDGRWLVISLGTSRFRVTRWLNDDPYPQAEIDVLTDEHREGEVAARRVQLEPLIRRVLALRQQLGEDGVPPDFELSSDPDVACWQTAVMAPLNAFDAQRLLSSDRCTDRLALLEELLIGLEETLRFRLNGEP